MLSKNKIQIIQMIGMTNTNIHKIDSLKIGYRVKEVVQDKKWLGKNCA